MNSTLQQIQAIKKTLMELEDWAYQTRQRLYELEEHYMDLQDKELEKCTVIMMTNGAPCMKL